MSNLTKREIVLEIYRKRKLVIRVDAIRRTRII